MNTKRNIAGILSLAVLFLLPAFAAAGQRGAAKKTAAPGLKTDGSGSSSGAAVSAGISLPGNLNGGSAPGTPAASEGAGCRRDVDANCNGIYDRLSPEGQDCSEPDRTGVDFSPTTCFYPLGASGPAGGGGAGGAGGNTGGGTDPGVKPPHGVLLDKWDGGRLGNNHLRLELGTGQSYALEFIPGAQGSFTTCETTSYSDNHEMAISPAPGVFSVADRNCHRSAGPLGSPLNYTTGPVKPGRGVCQLKPNTTYYFNLRFIGARNNGGSLKDKWSCSPRYDRCDIHLVW